MPHLCECILCDKFRANLPESKLTNEAIKALDSANAPSKNSRRARIKLGKGKSHKGK